MFLGLFALCIVVMRFFPETTLPRCLNSALVEKPLAWLAKAKHRDLIFLLVVVALLLVAGDFIAIFGMSDLLVIGANLSVYFDAVLVTTAVTITAAAATTWRHVRTRLAARTDKTARRPSRTARESRGRRTWRPKSNDDEDAPAWGLAPAV